jgi:hypothetical protein
MSGRVLDPPDGFAEFVTARSAALLRAAWLLTGEQLLTTYLSWWRRRTLCSARPAEHRRQRSTLLKCW